jgi:hypothetical protein
MIFKTESGSTYEVDLEKKLIRRLRNTSNFSPTERQGEDEKFKHYDHLTIELGKSVIIVWKQDVPLLAETQDLLNEQVEFMAIPATVTSRVVFIES